jgi:long-chain acyl-CoA synthetase
MATKPAARRGEVPPTLDAQTLCEAFQRIAAGRSDQVALRTQGGAEEITWGRYAERVRRIAAGLAAMGLGRGDTLALMLVNRPEFNLVDTAAMHLGATPFSVYNTSSPEQIEFLFSDAANRIVVTERAFLERVLAVRERVDSLEHIVLVDGEAEGAVALEDLERAEPDGFDFEGTWRALGGEDVLTLIYTSGTTGPPKGVQITHANMMAEWRALQAVFPTTPGGRVISFLPSAHIADRWSTHYGGMLFGFTVTCCPDPGKVLELCPEVRPTVFGAVPRIWEKLKAALEPNLPGDPPWPRELGDAVRAKLGLDHAEWFVSGAAPIPVEVLEFFAGLGIPICELWGLSETSCVATINPPDRIKIGTVGRALPGIEVKLAGDGEVLVRGPIVMAGYRNQPEKTTEAIDQEGWLHTGDVGEIDQDGYLTIIDRKKELIINAAGKNMSPANIEAALKASSPLIGQACVIGDRRPYNVALIVLDPDASAAFTREHDLDADALGPLTSTEAVIDEVTAGVGRANERLSRVEQVKRFKIIEGEWEPGGEELTPTMKLKRKPIADKYAEEIEALYLD